MSVRLNRGVLIAGGGIAGLTLAAALARRGQRTELVERASAWAPVGAGIGLGINAMVALRSVGVAERVLASGEPCLRWDIVDRRGRPIVHFDFADLARGVGITSVCVHRADLHAALRDGATVPHRLGVAVTDVVPRADAVEVSFSDGSTGIYDLVVGADGIRSRVRTAVFGAAPLRYSGYSSFRMVVDRPPGMRDILEMWGPGRRIGLSPINAHQLYCYTTHNAPAGEVDDPASRLATFRALFQGFGGRFPEVLAQLQRPDQLFRDDISELPIGPLWRGRVVLIGDAAHAMTPNLGQGGAMAIEDAVVLARTLERADTLEAALADFDARRATRVRSVQVRSRLLGRIGNLGPPLLCAMRDSVIRRFGGRGMWRLVMAAPRQRLAWEGNA